MAARKASKTTTRKSTPRAGAGAEDSAVFTEDERAAMRDYVKERKAARGGRQDAGADARAVLEKIAGMPEPDRSLASRVHEIVTRTAPALAPRLWYGMPAYARDGQVVCFFQDARKFKSRYATLGFSDKARLDDGAMWATSFAVAELTSEVEERIAALVRRAVG